jgi:hypothetical protein
MSPDVAQGIFVGIALIWGIVQTIISWRISRTTDDLNQQLHRVNLGLDQSIQRLNRARDLVNKIHEARLMNYYYAALEQEVTEDRYIKFVEESVYAAELRGIALAIGDEELLKLINKPSIVYEDKTPNFMSKEASIRNETQNLHTRIHQLLEQTMAVRHENS